MKATARPSPSAITHALVPYPPRERPSASRSSRSLLLAPFFPRPPPCGEPGCWCHRETSCLVEPRAPGLVLQLSLRTGFALMPLPVTVLGHGLMDAPPQRPAEEMIEHYAGRTLQAANELADLAHAEGDQSSRLRSPLLCDVTALSFTRRAARKPKASMASVMCRYQPCQERIS